MVPVMAAVIIVAIPENAVIRASWLRRASGSETGELGRATSPPSKPVDASCPGGWEACTSNSNCRVFRACIRAYK